MINLVVISDLVGMIGVSFVLLAFTLLNMNKLTPLSMVYQVMNLTGAIFLLFSLCFHWNISSVVIEIAWMAISIVGIVRILKPKGVKKPNIVTSDVDEDNIVFLYK